MPDLSPRTADTTRLHLRGELLTPLCEGGLWWPDRSTLIVSDLHFEKGSAFARRGQLLPPYDTAATLTVVEHLVATLKPVTIISLGDSFHDGGAEARLSDKDTARIRALTGAHDWIWVEGNHDPDPPEALGGRTARILNVGPLVFRHEPTGEVGEVSGHLHPVMRLSGPHRTLRRRCFVSDGCRLVMPAMGAFTGGLNVLDPAFSSAFPEGGMMVFAMGGDRVVPVRRDKLVPDRHRVSTGVWRYDGSAVQRRQRVERKGPEDGKSDPDR